jgi:hypothetical protein
MEGMSLNSLTLYTSNILIPYIDNLDKLIIEDLKTENSNLKVQYNYLHENLNIISNHLFESNIQINV